MLVAAMLNNRFRAALSPLRSDLAEVLAKFDRSWSEILLELQLMEEQIRNPNQHGGTCLTP